MNVLKKLTLGEFRDFTKDLPNNYELRISSVIKGDDSYHTSVFDISSVEDAEGNFIILEPSEIEVSDTDCENDYPNFRAKALRKKMKI
jgi:hypothetical protein